MSYSTRLREHAKKIGRDTRIALVGAGQMGRGFGNQLGHMDGIALSVVIDIDPERIKIVYADLGITDIVFSVMTKKYCLRRSLQESTQAHLTQRSCQSCP